MLDRIGSLRVRERSATHVALTLSHTTRIAGWMLLVAAAAATVLIWPVSRWLAAVPALVAALGLVMATLRRELAFDKEAGVLRMSQRVFGFGSRSVVPLFHLRAVVIVAGGGEESPARSPARYVAFIEKRVGDAIYLDEARRCSSLLPMAEAIAEIAELRLEYDAMSRASGAP